LKFGEIVIIQGDYKIQQLEFVKTLLICFNSPISAHTPCCGSFGGEKEKQRTLGVKFPSTNIPKIHMFQNLINKRNDFKYLGPH
jgi:hypothetical protein